MYLLALRGIKNQIQTAEACSSHSQENKSAIYPFSFGVFKHSWSAINNPVNCERLIVYLQSLLQPASTRTAGERDFPSMTMIIQPLNSFLVPYGIISHRGLYMVILMRGGKEHRGKGGSLCLCVCAG